MAPQSSAPTKVFLVSDAPKLGVTGFALRSEKYARPFHGVRISVDGRAAAVSRSQLIERAANEYAVKLSGRAAFSHTTALVLYGCPIFCSKVLHVTVSSGAQPRSRGVQGHQSKYEFVPAYLRNGLPLVTFERALIGAANELSFRELVVAIEHGLRPGFNRDPGNPESPPLQLEQLRERCATDASRGIVKLRAAAEFAQPGAESRMESLLRMLLAAYGLDVLERQVNIRDAAGRWIGRFDLVCTTRKVIVEYDGEQHRTDPVQYERDQERLDRVRDAGYRVLRLRRKQLIEEPDRTVQRIADLLGLTPRRARGALGRLLLG